VPVETFKTKNTALQLTEFVADTDSRFRDKRGDTRVVSTPFEVAALLATWATREYCLQAAVRTADKGPLFVN
jgi:hypothetical protein